MPKIGIALILLLVCAAARAQVSDPTPYLQIETGLHQATINRVVLLPDGVSIATVSDDKTARLWSANALTPLGVIRPPLGPNDDGVLCAVAASGKILAVGGRIRYGAQFAVQFYKLPDLKLIGHRSALPAPVSALRFSGDGNVLLAGMIGGRGLAFFDMRDGTQVGADIVYDGQVQWIDLADDGRAVATGEDGRIRLYGPDHLKLKDASLPRGGHPYAAAFSPDGGTIAVRDQNSATVWRLDATTLRPIRSLTGAPGRTGDSASLPSPTADAKWSPGALTRPRQTAAAWCAAGRSTGPPPSSRLEPTRSPTSPRWDQTSS